MSGKVAIVTGGGKGIGAEIALHLLSEGMRVIVAELNPSEKIFEFKDPSRLLLVKTDVKSERSIRQMVEKGIRHFGQIDCLINNAGILPDEKGVFEKITLKTWNDFIVDGGMTIKMIYA